MIAYRKVFLDTTPLIYFLDEDIHFGEKTTRILESILSNRTQVVSSVITCMEYLVYPYRTKNHEKINAFREFIADFEIPLIPLSLEIADKSAQIRAEYKYFKAMDSIQLATAVMAGCDVFLTNDNQLKQFKEVTCITVEEWILE